VRLAVLVYTAGNVERTFYDLLGVPPTASIEEIHAAYRKLAQIHHPDKPTGDESAFKEINEAHHVLSSGYRRSMYDAQRSVAAAQVAIRRTVDPKAIGPNVLQSIAFFAIGILCAAFGDRPEPNYNLWLVLLFYTFIALGICRLRYRAYRFPRYGGFLKAALVDTVAFLLPSVIRIGLVLLAVTLMGAWWWITKQ
jgi:curved DNA-binding protein CbpA